MRRNGLVSRSLFLVAAIGVCAGCRNVTAQERKAGTPVLLPDSPVAVSRTANVPESLRSAAQTLFQQGLADPKGGEYQEVTVQVGDVWGRAPTAVKTHGWVLPQRTGETETRAVCPNGLLYTVRSVGAKASIDDDVANYIRGQGESRKGIRLYRFDAGDATPEAQLVSYLSPSLPYICLLLRVDTVKAAEALSPLLVPSTVPNIPSNAGTDPYDSLVNRWAWSLYDRAVCAHMRGDDTLAAADASLLTQAKPQIMAEIEKRRAAQSTAQSQFATSERTALPFLKNLPMLLADAERRAAAGTAASVDLASLGSKSQKDRIALLIADLENVAARQSGQPGGVGLDASPICEALIAEGDAAVDPLLDVLENDKRLTRSVSFGRDFFQDRNLLSVRSAAFACIVRITGVSEFGDEGNVKAIRAWWAKNKGMSEAERWYSQLADENGSVAAKSDDPNASFAETRANDKRWSEAASTIVERSDVTRHGQWIALPRRKSGQPLPPFRGEPLRAQKNPSVSELLAKRALQMTEPQENRWGFDYQHGATFALQLYVWDPKNPLTLPTLRKVMKRCLDFQAKQEKRAGNSEQFQLGGRIARLTIARVALGDAPAAAEYAAWLKSVTPEYLGNEMNSALYAFVYDPRSPSLQRAAAEVFRDRSNRWGKLFDDTKSRDNYPAYDLLSGLMVRVPSFREQIVARLQDRTEAGSVVSYDFQTTSGSFKWLDGSSFSGGFSAAPTKRQPLAKTVRVCDRVAIGLQGLPGVPAWIPVASASERDKQCAAIAQYLNRYASVFREAEQYDRPIWGFDRGSRFGSVQLGFDTASTPATARDVATNRAIFHLDNGAKTRVVYETLPSLPIDASWANAPDARVTEMPDGTVNRFAPGKIYQAEEVWDGQQWLRYYGFVGLHTIAKVPTKEITITDYRLRSPQNGTLPTQR